MSTTPKYLTAGLAIGSLVALSACGGNGDGENGGASDTSFITIGSGGSGGTFFAYSGAYADVVSGELDITANVEETGGSVENVRLVANGDSDLGVAQADVVADALEGTGDFDEEQDVRVIGAMYPNYLQLVTSQDSGLETFQDLIDNNISISTGPAGGGQEVTFRTTTEALGFDFDDFGSISNLGFDDQNQAFSNDQIDVGNYMTARGTGNLIELASIMDIAMIEFSDEELDTIISQEPYFVEGEIPAGTYDGIDEDIVVPALWNYYIIHADTDEDLVYDLTAALYENASTIEGSVPQATETTVDAVADIGAPLHPGSARYFEDEGIDIPEDAQPLD